MTTYGTGRGLFIAFEGGDGTGKSTQMHLLEQWLTGIGHRPVVTREPGGTALGRTLREAVLHSETLDAKTEALLYAADRAHHIATVIQPAMATGTIVLTDRFVDSSLAYQGTGREIEADQMSALQAWVTGGLRPDLTLLLDLDPVSARDRITGNLDRLERESTDFHTRVREGFLRLSREEPARYLVLDASLSPEQVHSQVRNRVKELIAS